MKLSAFTSKSSTPPSGYTNAWASAPPRIAAHIGFCNGYPVSRSGLEG